MRFSIFYKSTSGVRFSESARKMTQNGGRIVAIGSIFEIFLWRIYTGDVEKMPFSIFYKSTAGVCFSESARKMTQNGGRVVPI